MKTTLRLFKERGARSQAREQTSCDLRSRYERALAMAQGYEAAGDRIAAERLFQQADHLRRLLNLKAA